jgi:hypothetical protein
MACGSPTRPTVAWYRSKLRGRLRPRLLRSVERLVSIVIADVDADGDLDILASTIREGLLLWRNGGRGHFVLARLPKARDALPGPRFSRVARARILEEPGESGADGAIPQTERGCDPLVLRSFLPFESFSPLAQYRVAPRAARRPRSPDPFLCISLGLDGGPCRRVCPCVYCWWTCRARRVRIEGHVVGGYGSRLLPFSRVTRVIGELKRRFLEVPACNLLTSRRFSRDTGMT